MKIAIWHNLPSGGGKRALYYQVKGLVERGHDVECWCPLTADQSFAPLSDFIVEHKVTFVLTPPKKSLRGRLLSDYHKVADKLEAMDEHCKKCAIEIEKGGFDVLFSNACTFFRVSPISHYVKLPKILYLQEPYRWLYEALPQLPWLALPSANGSKFKMSTIKTQIKDFIKIQGLRVQAREEVNNARAYDDILVNSLFSRESILRAYGLDSKVCYLGVDMELFHPTGVPREHLVIGVGGIYIGKRIDIAIRALSTINKSERPPLVWVGNFSDKAYQNKMEELALCLGVNVTFKVLVNDDELVDLLNRAAVMIYTPQLEPFGFAPLEANACETPVVAIAEGGVRESIKDGVNGFLVEHADFDAIGQAILKLLRKPLLAREMGANARKYVLENWSWDAAIDRLENYLLAACNNHK